LVEEVEEDVAAMNPLVFSGSWNADSAL
jgi:hypothetical protein